MSLCHRQGTSEHKFGHHVRHREAQANTSAAVKLNRQGT